MEKNKAPAQVVQGLEDGINCLLHLVSSDVPVGSRELARELSLEPTKVNRLLGTLAHMGLAERTPARKYVAASGVNVLAALSLRSSPLLRAGLGYVEELAQELGRNIALGVLWGRQVCYLFHGQRGGLASISGHNLFPAEESSIGLAMLAYCSNDYIKQLYPQPSKVLSSVRKVRKDGYAIGSQMSLGVCIGGKMQLGGLALSRIDEQKDDVAFLVSKLNECAGKIVDKW